LTIIITDPLGRDAEIVFKNNLLIEFHSI
jgi:hypothetical protein